MFLLPHKMVPQRFDETTGTMVPDPNADTAKELERMRAFQASNSELVAKRMPPPRNAKRALQKRANEKSRAATPGKTTLADLQAGRASRVAAQRSAVARVANEADGQLAQALAELEQCDATIAQLRSQLAQAQAQIAASSAPIITEIRDMVSALLDNAVELQRAAAASTAPVDDEALFVWLRGAVSSVLKEQAAASSSGAPVDASTNAEPAASSSSKQHHDKHDKKHK